MSGDTSSKRNDTTEHDASSGSEDFYSADEDVAER